MLFERRQPENQNTATKVVKVTPQSMAALVKAQKIKGLVPATLQTNDEGQQIFRPVLGTHNF